jgi:hypothetical protein
MSCDDLRSTVPPGRRNTGSPRDLQQIFLNLKGLDDYQGLGKVLIS